MESIKRGAPKMSCHCTGNYRPEDLEDFDEENSIICDTCDEVHIVPCTQIPVQDDSLEWLDIFGDICESCFVRRPRLFRKNR